MLEITLVLIKPDAVYDDVWLKIIGVYRESGLIINWSRILTMSKYSAERFYSAHKGQTYYRGLIDHMTSGPIIAMTISGENAIQRVRDLNGATNPAKAKEGTIRRIWGYPNGGPKNAVHGSDSKESFEREVVIIRKIRRKSCV